MPRFNPSLYILIILCFTLLPRVSFAQLQINSITSTTSTCSNNGSITVNAITPVPPMLYSITAGPVTAPIQTVSVFNSLPPGTYDVKVTDAASNSVTGSVTIAGNYLQPDMDPIKTPPYCIGSSTGQIIGNRLAGTGNGPYTWQLLSPSPVTTIPQASDTFDNLPAGNYTLRLNDACGGFRTIVITLSDPPLSNVSFQTPPQINMIGCDSAMVTMYLRADLFRFPFTFTFVTNAGTFTTNAPSFVDTSQGTGYFTIEQIIPNFTYGNSLQITITDNCGFGFSSPTYYAKSFVFCPVFNSHFTDCDYKTSIYYNLNNTGCDALNTIFTNLKPPLIYSVTDAVTNVIVDKDTLPGYPGIDGYPQISGFDSKDLVTNKTYNVTIKDGCGRNFSNQIFVPAPATLPPPVVVYKQLHRDACLDSAINVSINVNYFKRQPQLVLLSGPSRMGSTKPGYAYESAYAYPDTLEITGYGAFTYVFDINNLSAGTYQFKVIDSCGSEVFDSLNILPSQVTDFSHNFTYKKGCLGRNELLYTIHSANGTMYIKNLTTNVETIKYYQSQDFDTPIYDSSTNLASGAYELTFVYSTYFASGKPANSIAVPCQQVKETVVIAGYQTPTIIAHNYVSCKQDVFLEIIADSSKGVPPYEYEIVSGPQVYPMQPGNFFSINIAGTYTVRIYDVCGNASTSQITVTQIVVPPITELPFSCNSKKLTFGSSAFYTYNWTAPNGKIFTGDTLNINPITPADTGIYTIQRITDINGCRDTSYSSYHLVSANIFERLDSICPGNSITIGTHTYNSTGNYTDTLKNINGCDSIVFLRLTVLPLKKDTVYKSICPGMQFQFNGKSYTTAGIYSDTLATSTCDSIATLVLSVGLKQQSVSVSVCENTSYNFNGRILTLPGVYRDTLPTVTCDSIIILNLSVLPLKRNVFDHTICEGDQFNFNGRIITTGGTYTDTLSTTTCDSIITVNISVVSPTIQITASEQTIVAGDVVQLQATDALTYLWTGTGVSFNNAGIYNPGATLSVSAWIYLQATSNPDGCRMNDSVFINVIDRSTYCIDSYMYMPTAFTPNGDGLNDVFRIVSKKISLKTFRVFNRWGELVFVTNDLNIAWNGEYKGQRLAGAYVYYVTYTDCMGETRLVKGTITMIR
jgi:gliding motility-associated-like protein